MAYQTIFKRYEFKYILTKEQKQRVLSMLQTHITPDKYGRTTIRNLYFDTDNYRLIRRSIEKPVYKEKLRLRSYQQASPESDVFAELKKKYQSVVYKRRMALPESVALKWLCEKEPLATQTQISKEIDYFISYYGNLHPTVFLSYEREAYYAKVNPELRITFDENVLCRQTDLSLAYDAYGTSILDEDKVLMEIKCAGGFPLWLTNVLSEEKIYKTSFSKYGTTYETLIFPKLKEEHKNGIII